MTEILQKENFDHYEGVMRENLRESLAGFTVGVKFLFDISPSFVGILARNFEGV